MKIYNKSFFRNFDFVLLRSKAVQEFSYRMLLHIGQFREQRRRWGRSLLVGVNVITLRFTCESVRHFEDTEHWYSLCAACSITATSINALFEPNLLQPVAQNSAAVRCTWVATTNVVESSTWEGRVRRNLGLYLERKEQDGCSLTWT